MIYFVNSGSEANDLALLMSRMHTGVFDVISLRYVTELVSLLCVPKYLDSLTTHGSR